MHESTQRVSPPLVCDTTGRLQLQMQASAAAWNYQELSEEVRDLSGAIWSQSSMTEVLAGLVEETVDVTLGTNLAFRAKLSWVWREIVLFQQGDYRLVPIAQLKSVKSPTLRPRLGGAVEGLKLVTVLRRLLDQQVKVQVALRDESCDEPSRLRQLCWVGRDWVGISPVGGGPLPLEICSVEHIRDIRFSSLVTPRQIGFDLRRLDTPLTPPTNL
jgi:hypothetical protein